MHAHIFQLTLSGKMVERICIDIESTLRSVYKVRRTTGNGSYLDRLSHKPECYYPLARFIKHNFGSDAVPPPVELEPRPSDCENSRSVPSPDFTD